MSSFGRSFTRYSGNPLRTIVSCDPWDARGDPMKTIPGALHPTVLYFPGGIDGYEFWMIFTPAPKIGTYPQGAPPPPISTTGPDYWWERCTLVRSHDGINWEKTRNYTNPLISPGEPGSWDEGWHCDPDVVYTPDQGPGGKPRWFLYYCGCGKRPTYGSSIGLAISDDGLHYRKVGDGPLKGHVFKGDKWHTRCPSAVYDIETKKFHMWYNWGSWEIGYATSDDGIHWTPYNPVNPGEWGYVVLRPTPGTFDAYGITHQDVILYEGQYWMYYIGLPTKEYAGLVVGLATSPDGINWTKYEEPVFTPGTDPWESGSLYHPSPVMVGDKMYLYYTGITSYVAYPLKGDAEIGVAFSKKTWGC